MAVLVVSGEFCKLILLNLKTKQEVKPPISLKKCTGHNIILSAGNIVQNSIVLQESREMCCIVSELNEVSFHT